MCGRKAAGTARKEFGGCISHNEKISLDIGKFGLYCSFHSVPFSLQETPEYICNDKRNLFCFYKIYSSVLFFCQKILLQVSINLFDVDLSWWKYQLSEYLQVFICLVQSCLMGFLDMSFCFHCCGSYCSVIHIQDLKRHRLQAIPGCYLDFLLSLDFVQDFSVLCDYMHDIWPLMPLYF